MFSNNLINGNDTVALVRPSVPGAFDTSSSFIGNVDDVIRVQGSALIVSTSWPDVGPIYRVEGPVEGWQFESPAVLTIDPGVTVLFEDDAGLEFGDLGMNMNGPVLLPGSLQAIGTPESPITFGSAAPVPLAGDWQGLRFSPEAASSTLQHCVIQHAGDHPSPGAVVVEADGLTVSDCSIAETDGWGVYQDGATATLSGNSFAGNSAGDVFP